MSAAASMIHSIGPHMITGLFLFPRWWVSVLNRKIGKKEKKKSPLISYAPSACQCINGILTTALYTANLLQLEELSAEKKLKKLEPKQESEIRDKHISVYNSLPA